MCQRIGDWYLPALEARKKVEDPTDGFEWQLPLFFSLLLKSIKLRKISWGDECWIENKLFL